MFGGDAARRVLEDAIRSRMFPGAVVDVGHSAGPLWQDAIGTLAFADDDRDVSPATLATPYDLASLTKPIATTAILMRLVERGAVALDERVAAAFPESTGAD